MADEDRTRAQSQGANEPTHRPASHRAHAVDAAQNRSALRRIARARRRRRWALEGIAALVCLIVLGTYLGTRAAPEPDGDAGGGPGGVPAGASRPTGFPGAEGRTNEAGPATPGLRPRERPPSPDPTPSAPAPPSAPPPRAPAAPVLSVSQVEAPAEIDLSAVGARDWMHWGLRGGNSKVSKRAGTGEIVDAGGRGNRVAWDGNQEVVRWSDGTPERTVGGSSNGVYTCGVGNGFSLAVEGSGEPRTVHLYAGTWMARGRLDARLSTGGPISTVRLEDPYTSRSAQFTIRFVLPRGARLVVTWTVEKVFTEHCGNVGLQAVALR
ncbi:hypothetical protein [Micromonospora profundi]|uniref:Uncharacterized protein n=1 Tax=Micromonospora profundi TaxID=1420889 RepID=A0AAJ6HSJ3_9ACTN|nr:hypothetical protein [Micromonospora profundi]WLS45996.1 hypothetical protein Q3V37_01535 [Micromonospora profundi]